MTDRLQAAQAALNAGKRDEAIDHLKALVDAEPAQGQPVYKVLVIQCYNAGRYEEGATYGKQAIARFPRDYDLHNVYGVLLRKLGRQREAVPVLEQAIRINPKTLHAYQNLGNILLDLNELPRAEQIFTRLVRTDPRSAEFQRQLGRALMKQGKVQPALVRFRQAVALKKDFIDAWLDMVGTMNEEFRTEEANEILDRALAANPGNARLLEGRAVVYRRAGQLQNAETFLRDLLPTRGDEAWLHYQLGLVIADVDRDQANVHFDKAVQLEPAKLDYIQAYLESLERTRSGDEGANIERAYQMALELLPRRNEFIDSTRKIMTDIFVRVCDFDSLDRVGDFRTLGRGWAENGRHTALLKQLARVRSEEDRLELVEQHRIWGRGVEAAAARRPIPRPEPRPRGSKVRLGFMSSDLRHHPVGYFAMPLFDHVDRDRFEVFVYSYYSGKEDQIQQYITSRIDGYRWWPAAGTAFAAEHIAADRLDMLIELGGSTHMNKLDVMAYKVAPLQASWLGYPHSAGLSTIDYFICDRHNLPTRPEYLIETPLLMPESWIALGQRFFSDANVIREAPPSDLNGFVTYGTANNPHKYNNDMFAQWARIVAATPNSRFCFLRPEGGSASFRKNIEAQFARAGVSADRIIWHAVRGSHMPFYNDMDISLDTFPLTGGTTTTESLWMGVPLISLVGETFYERLSYSIMCNAGLGDLCAHNVDDYMALALKLAADVERRREIRKTIREDLRNSALGQTDKFARDFYDLIYKTVTERLRA